MDHSNHRRHEHRKRVAIPIPAPVAEPDPQGGTMTVVQVVYVTGDSSDVVTPNAEDVVASRTQAIATTPTPRRNTSQVGEDDESEKSETTFKKSTKSATLSESTPAFSSGPAFRTSAFNSATATLGSAGGPTETATASNNTGLTTGTFAGIVGGGVAVVLILIAAIAIIMKRKKNSNYGKTEDEKSSNRLSFNDRSPPSPVPMPTQMTQAAAPKLQIRPMTQFDSSFFPSGSSDTMRSEDKPVRAPPLALSMDKQNLGVSPFENPEPSPAMSAFSDNSKMSLPIQGAASGSAPSPVHRIVVDFKPSMADELELCAGEVVRLLHEYDDGWALCIRMDRSQQGVCPRTCLSQRPVKVRPPAGGRAAPPPPTNAMRGNGGQSRPQSPAGRPQSPGMGPGSRPHSPRGSGPNRPPMSPKGMPGPPRSPMGPDSRPSSPMGGRQPHPLSKVQRDDDIQFHAM